MADLFFTAKQTSDESSGAGKIFPEFFWCAAFFLFKQAVKVADIIKAAAITYFGDRVGGVN